MDLLKKLQIFLYDNDLTQTVCAKKLGVTNDHLSRVLSKKVGLSPRLEFKIKKFLGIEEEEGE